MSIKNENPRKDWHAGQTCFCYDGDETRMVPCEVLDVDHRTETALLRVLEGARETRVPLDCIFDTHQAAMSALTKRNDEIYDGYVEEIRTVQDLVAFGYAHAIHGRLPDTDWEARAAYRDRARELLGVILPQ